MQIIILTIPSHAGIVRIIILPSEYAERWYQDKEWGHIRRVCPRFLEIRSVLHNLSTCSAATVTATMYLWPCDLGIVGLTADTCMPLMLKMSGFVWRIIGPCKWMPSWTKIIHRMFILTNFWTKAARKLNVSVQVLQTPTVLNKNLFL